MSIDASIAMGIKPPQFESPLNNLAGMLQIQGAQQANQLNTMKMDEYRAGAEEKNALRSIYQQPGFDGLSPAGLRQIATVNPKLAGELFKQVAEAGKVDAETKSKNLSAAMDRHNAWSRTMGALVSRPDLSKAMAIQAGQQLVDMGIMSREMFDTGVAKLPDDPEQLRAQIKAGRDAQLTPEQMVTLFSPKVSTVDNGQQIFRVDDNPNSPTFGRQVGAAPIQKQQDPNSVASVAAQMANAAATRDVAQSNRDAATIQTGFQNESALRKEFEGLPEIKNYKQAFPAYAAIKDAASRSTTQADINIVYGLAKLYDPTSVVREGEYATVANSPNIPERIKGYAQYLQGGGKLSPETKRQIMTEADGRIQTYKAEADKAKGSYENIAKRRGIEPSSVFQDMGDMGSKPKSDLQEAAAAELRRRQGGK